MTSQSRWSFGVSVVAALGVTIIKLSWVVFSLPLDDNGGGMLGAMVVNAIDFMLNLVVLEVVRHAFLRFTSQSTK
jgi:hypothetical protein